MIAELRQVRRREMARLRDLSVQVSELAGPLSRRALVSFAEQFVGPDKGRDFLAAADVAAATFKEIDYGRWLRQDARPHDARPGLAWLTRGLRGAVCVRFDPRVVFPAMRLTLDRMLDEWALTWPGAFVSFDTARALSVSIDYDVTCCDLSALRASPYR